MEIFIIGLIVVIAMVIISTKIKKQAARAFEPEVVETEFFRIEKAEGFMYPLRDAPDFPFEAYSKLYGERSTRNIWRARIRLRISDGRNLEKIFEETEKSPEKILARENLENLPERQTGAFMRTEKTEDEIEYEILRKIIESETLEKTFELRTTILKPFTEEYRKRVGEMMASFEVR